MTTRRELIQWLAATSGLASLASRDLVALGRDAHHAAAVTPGVRVALAPDADRTVAAAAEAILPGAGAAGVGAFVDHMLAGWYAPEERDRFLAGLGELDARSRARHGQPFADASPADQAALLTAFDDDVTALRSRNAAEANRHWFAVLKYLTVWGYCTSATGAEQLGLASLPMRYDGNAAR